MKKTVFTLFLFLIVPVFAEMVLTDNGRTLNKCSDRSINTAVIPDGVETIASAAFYGCEYLVQITIPASVRHIKNHAFAECTSLTLDIPVTVTEIEEGAFQGVRRVNIAPDHPRYTATAHGAVIDRQSGKLLYVPPEVTGVFRIPRNIRRIGEYAFFNCALLTAVIFTAEVKSIGEYAFQKCSGLERITLVNGLEVIGPWAFAECKNLRNIVIPASVKTIGSVAFFSVPRIALSAQNRHFRLTSEGSLIEPGRKRFIYCPPGRDHCTIPENIQLIDDLAFAFCTGLKRITIPASVRIIGQSAFYACENLERVDIPAGVRRIEKYAFLGCSKLERVIVRGPAVICEGAFGRGCYEENLTKAYICRQARIHRDAFPEWCEIIRRDFNN